jgi:diguanylate cyclase (GGDEF)-like protein
MDVEDATMQKQNGNQISLPFEEFVPEIYMPRLQLFIRIMLGIMAAVYFNYIPIPLLILSTLQINLIIISYIVFHSCGWWYYKRYGAKNGMIRLGSWIDIMGAVTAILCDPFTIPPMLLLLLIAALGNGIQHGLNVAVESMIGAPILGGAALAIHFRLLGDWPPYNFYFYVLLIAVGLYYSYLLVLRLERMKRQAVRIGEQDPLTGIPNRRPFLRVAEYLLSVNERSPIPLVFVFADLDNFKAVNDRFGHEMGDRVLVHFSGMAKARLRKSDIIARYGGDEFAMILTNTSPGSAESLLQQLQREFWDWAKENGFPVGFSFGLGMAPEGKNNLDDILRQVDTALYEAKTKKDRF